MLVLASLRGYIKHPPGLLVAGAPVAITGVQLNVAATRSLTSLRTNRAVTWPGRRLEGGRLLRHHDGSQWYHAYVAHIMNVLNAVWIATRRFQHMSPSRTPLYM